MNENNWRTTVEAAGRGDEKAFETLYRETERSVYFTCLNASSSTPTATARTAMVGRRRT